MKMTKLLLLTLLTSCAFFVSKIDSEIVKDKNYLKNIPTSASYCPLEQKTILQLINSNPKSQEIFSDFIGRHPEYNFVDQFIFWSLIQMAIRPDQSSPSSRLQLIISTKTSPLYLDFFSDQDKDQYPFIFGLEWVSKKLNGKRLEHYAQILDSQLSQKFKVEKYLEIFLEKNKDNLRQNIELAPFFIRGTEILKEGERVPDLKFTQLIKFYRKIESKQKITIHTSLNKFTTSGGQVIQSNYDFNLYQNSIFLIDQEMPISNIFGLSSGQDVFLASTNQKIESISGIDSLPLFYGSSKVRSSAFCLIQNQKDFIWLISNMGRDPGQHLFHLIKYGMASSDKIETVDTLIRHSRYLFLSDPVRLVIESRRSRPDQIENLLKLSLPIYNAEKLGNIWSFSKFGAQARFILDDRNPGNYSCK
jgi:hypothetical protein